jgi:nudix-type nucleoside diphosphatase (YffH/AdpP family)
VRGLKVEVLSDAWYTLRRATFELRHADGTWATTSREAYDRGNGAAALLHDPERDTVVLVRQYRLPVHLNDHPDGMLLEAPGGLLDAREGAEEALRRELAEEIGHSVGPLHERYKLYMSPGSVTEHVTLFTGSYGESTRLTQPVTGGETDESVDVVELALDEAIAMVDDGRICDAKTVILIERLRRDRG